ncbi:hypothetical protein [Fibrobacter succinogenes]|uniref:hypothetical protein n=1 Tax=Fibrobacter succinogenes TaxID=833 RepID=UPI001568B694|nr:hypothetical protein [Fibrobacter succinogenes]
MNYYRISPEKVDSLAKLDSLAKPADVALQVLKNMQGVDFPDTSLVHHYALKALAVYFNNMCGESFDGDGVQDKNCSDKQWTRMLDYLDTLYRNSILPSLSAVLEHVDGFYDAPLLTNGKKSCGCSSKDKFDSEIFGIYPYWYVGDSTKWIDFEGVTRLEFYGLYADDKGTLHLPSGTLASEYLSDEKNYEFVNEVHRHFVKFDWIVQKDDWNYIDSKESFKKFFENLVNEIEMVVNKKINSGFQRFVNTLSFYADDFEYRGDGVTLRFKNYPKDSIATNEFKVFFRKLNKVLSAENAHAFVNVMMDRLDLVDSMGLGNNNGIYSYKYFADIGVFPEDYQKFSKNELKNYLFVVLEEPTSHSKRFVLNDLDQQVDGKNRRDVIHSVVPMVWFDNKQWYQLQNDEPFYNDTYFGFAVGPYATDVKAKDVCFAPGNLGTCIVQFFGIGKNRYERQGSIAAFACKHRWIFRLLNLLSFLIAVGVLVSYFVSDDVEDFFRTRLVLLLGIVVLPSVITMAVVMLFDPFVTFINGLLGLLPNIVLFLVAVAIILMQAREKRDVPTRRVE